MGRIVDASFFSEDVPAVKELPSITNQLSGVAATAGQGLAGNFIDEAGAGINSVAGYLGSNLPTWAGGAGQDVPLSNIYDEQLGSLRQGISNFKKENPGISTASTLVGSVYSPLNKIKIAQGLLGVVGSGVAQGGVQGFGAGEGDFIERAQNAGQEGIISGLFSGGASVVGKGLKKLGSLASDLGEATKNNAYGVYAADIKKSLDKGVRAAGDVTAPVVKSLDRLIKSKDIIAGDATTNLGRIESQLDDLTSNLKNNLKSADAVQVDELVPKYDKTLEFIKKLDPTARKQAVSKFEELAKDQLADNAMISDWEQTKSALQRAGASTYGATGSDALEANLKKYMAFDIKKAVDTELQLPHYEQKLGKNVFDEIKNTRQALADRFTLLPVMTKGAAREASDGAVGKVLKTIATTGGYGVPALLTGSLPAALAIGAVANTATGKRAIASGLNTVGSRVAGTGAGLDELASEIGRGSAALGLGEQIVNSIKSKESQSVPSTSKPMGRVVDSSFFAPDDSEPLALNTAPISEPSTTKTPSVLLDSIRHVESSDGKYLVSNKGALGPYQIMPEVGKTLIERRFGKSLDGKELKAVLMDEATSRLLADDLMQENINRFGDMDQAVAAYNAGAPAVAKYGGVPPFKETTNYVKKVNLALNKLMGENYNG